MGSGWAYYADLFGDHRKFNGHDARGLTHAATLQSAPNLGRRPVPKRSLCTAKIRRFFSGSATALLVANENFCSMGSNAISMCAAPNGGPRVICAWDLGSSSSRCLCMAFTIYRTKNRVYFSMCSLRGPGQGHRRDQRQASRHRRELQIWRLPHLHDGG